VLSKHPFPNLDVAAAYVRAFEDS